MEVKIKKKGSEETTQTKSNPDPLAQGHLPEIPQATQGENVIHVDFTPKNNESIDLDAFWEYLCETCQLDSNNTEPRPASSLYELDPNLLRGLRSPKNVHGA